MMKFFLALFTAALICAPVFADVIAYQESFDGADNAGWGTDHALWDNLFGSNYDGNGAQHSATGGYSGGYDYTNFAWVSGHWNLIFADDGASDDRLAGNKNYNGTPALVAYLKHDYSGGPAGTFFFASTEGTTPGSTTTLYYYKTMWTIGNSWALYTADLTDSTKWTRMRGTRDWSTSIGDVDLVGIMFLGNSGGTTPQFMVDNFTATPEPASLLMMGPLAGFLGWRLARRKTRRTSRPD